METLSFEVEYNGKVIKGEATIVKHYAEGQTLAINILNTYNKFSYKNFVKNRIGIVDEHYIFENYLENSKQAPFYYAISVNVKYNYS